MNIYFLMGPSQGCHFPEGKDIVFLSIFVSFLQRLQTGNYKTCFVWLLILVPEYFKFELITNI